MATTPVFDPTQPYTEVWSAPSTPAKPVFDPTQPYTEVSRRDRLKELEGQITSSVDAPADVKAKLESDYANEVKAYQDETSLLGRIKDKFQDFDLKTSASKAWDAVVDSTWGAAEEANKRIGAALKAKKKAGEDVGITDVVKAMATEGAKPAAAGAAVGVMDALQGTADIAASGIATNTRVVGDIIGSDALKRFSAELETQRVMKAAEKEKAASDLKAGLGIESESKVFGGGRLAGGVVTPMGIPGAQKALAAAGKASEGVADVVSAGAKKAAGQSLRAASKVPSVLADIATIKAASMMPAPAVGLGSLAGAPRFATNMMSDDSVLGLGKYVKAASDAMASRFAKSTGNVADDFISNNVVRIDNLTQAIGDWSTDIQRKLVAKPSGAGDILSKTKVGQSIVDEAESVGAGLIRAQGELIGDIQKKLDAPGLTVYQRSVLSSKLRAAEARQASIAAGISVVKKLGAAEKITDTASRILADATLGATAGAALASMTATPGSDSIDDGIASGAFYGTLLGTLGRAAIKRAPESTAATVDQPVTPKDLDLIVKSPEYLDLVRAETVDLIKRPADGLEVVDSVPEDAIWVNAPSTVQKSTGVEVGDSVPKNAPAMLESGVAPKALLALQPEVGLLESGRTPKALRALQPEVGLLESGRTPKALRAPVAEELPLGNTKASTPDMVALRARVEKTQKVIDELSAKDVTEGLTDNELVTLEQAEATIARDVETLKGLEASELTSTKKSRKILAMEKAATETSKEHYENVKKTVEDLHKEVVKEDKAVGGALNPGVKDLSKYEAAYKKWEAAKAELDKLSDELWNESRASKKTTTEVVDDKTANARVSGALEDARKSFNIEKTTKEYEDAVKKYMYAAPEDRQALWGGVVKELNKMIKDAGPRKAKKKVLSAAKLPKQEPTAPAPAPSQTDSFTVDSILKRKTRMTDTSIGDAIKHIEDLDLDLLSPADATAVQKAREALTKEYEELIAKIEDSGVAFRTKPGQTGPMADLKAAALNMAAYGNYANDAAGLSTLLKKAKSGKATQQEIEQLNSAGVDTDNIDYEIEKNRKHYERLSDAYLATNRFINREGKHITALSDDLRGIEGDALSPRQFTKADTHRANLASFHEITPEALNSRVEKFRSDLTKTASVLGDVPAEISSKIENLTDMFVEDIRRDLAWKAKNPGMMAAGPAANKRSSKYPEMSVTKDVLAKFEQNVNGALLRRKAELNAPKREAALAKKKESAAAADESVKAATKASVGTADELISALKDFSKSTGRTQQKASANAALKLIKEKGVSPTASTESIQGLYADIASGKAYSNHLPNVVKF